jgi:hypothetical protein
VTTWTIWGFILAVVIALIATYALAMAGRRMGLPRWTTVALGIVITLLALWVASVKR